MDVQLRAGLKIVWLLSAFPSSVSNKSLSDLLYNLETEMIFFLMDLTNLYILL